MNIQYRTRKLPEYKAQGREVVKVLNERPHLVVRVEVRGEQFPHRAAHPFMHIRTDDDNFIDDLFTEVAPDGSALIGYLPVDIPDDTVIEFGYGNEIWGIVPVDIRTSVDRLERSRLPREVIVVDHAFVQHMKKR
jgi:hypothetical protein